MDIKLEGKENIEDLPVEVEVSQKMRHNGVHAKELPKLSIPFLESAEKNTLLKLLTGLEEGDDEEGIHTLEDYLLDKLPEADVFIEKEAHHNGLNLHFGVESNISSEGKNYHTLCRNEALQLGKN